MKKDGFIYKIYPKNTLLDDCSLINKRIALINSFDSKKHSALVNTQIIEHSDHYSYQQELLNIKKISALKKTDFLNLITALEFFESINFIHADLNKKNIIYTDNGFKIIDYEPSLVQIKNQKRQLMVTLPYVLKSDLDKTQVSTVTDKLAFFYFVLRVNNAFGPKQIVQLSKNFNHNKYLEFDINTIGSVTYEELLNRAYLKVNTSN